MASNSLSRDIHALLRCRDLQELLDTARRYLSNPLVLADLACHVLAFTAEGHIEDPRWAEIRDKRTMLVDLVNIEQYRSALRSDSPVLSSDATGLPIVRCAIGWDGRLIGYLVSPCYAGTPTQEQLDLIQVLGDLCALRMQKDLHYNLYPENRLEFFISDLLQGAIRDEDTLADRCRYLGWNLKTPYRILSVKPKGSAITTGGDYLALDRQRDALQRQFPEATVFLYGSQIKIIIPVRDQSVRDAMILHDVTAFLEGRSLAAGVSQTSWHLRNMAARHQQSVKALELGLLLGGAGPLYHYTTYSIYHCMEMCASQINLLELCHSAVLTLEAYDRKQGTELLGTLHAYLASHNNLTEAAARLFIHRNTLTKRLEKINDLIHVDFDDVETVFHLMFSYRIIEYYGVTVLRDSYESWVEKVPTLRHP